MKTKYKSIKINFIGGVQNDNILLTLLSKFGYDFEITTMSETRDGEIPSYIQHIFLNKDHRERSSVSNAAFFYLEFNDSDLPGIVEWLVSTYLPEEVVVLDDLKINYDRSVVRVNGVEMDRDVFLKVAREIESLEKAKSELLIKE